MCNPALIAVAQLGIGIASSAVSYSGQQAQYKEQRRFAEQTAINASKAASTQYDNLNRKMVQEDLAAGQAVQQTNIEAARMAATAEVASAEGGVSGLSVDHVLRDLYAQQGKRSSAIDVNNQMTRVFTQGEKDAAYSGGQSQANSVPTPEKPSILPALINVFGTGINAYGQYKANSAAVGKKA